MIQKGLRAQPGKPTGIVGRIVGYIMNVYNREDNYWTVSLLDIGSTSKVLEIGFGGGLAIAVRLNARSTTTTIANVVPSLVVAVLSLVVRWHQQWCNERLFFK